MTSSHLKLVGGGVAVSDLGVMVARDLNPPRNCDGGEHSGSYQFEPDRHQLPSALTRRHARLTTMSWVGDSWQIARSVGLRRTTHRR